MKRIWKQRWFILASLIAVFLMTTVIRVQAAGTDVQLDKILKSGLDGLSAYLAWLLDVMKEVWK